MKKQVVNIYILLIIVSACETDDAPPVIRTIPPKIQPILEQFILEAERRGVILDISKLSFEFQERIELGPNQGLAVASCTKSEDVHLVKIDTTNTFWIFGGKLGQEEVIFHELGHCLLDRPHKDLKINQEDFVSIMRTQGNLSYSSFNRTEVSKRSFRRDYYINELFDESTPLPCWVLTGQQQVPSERIIEENFLNEGFDYQMIIDGQDQLWLYSRQGVMREGMGGFSQELSDMSVNCMYLDQQGQLWIAGIKNNLGVIGIYREGKFNAVFEDQQELGPLALITHFIIENERIWFSTSQGQLMVQQDNTFNELSGLGNSGVLQIKRGPQNTILVAKGLSFLIFRDPNQSPEILSAATNSLPSGFIWDIEVDRDETIWMAMNNSFLVQLRMNDGITQLNNHQINIPELRIRSMTSDRMGNVWIGTSNGIRRWEQEYFSYYCQYNPGILQMDVIQVEVDSKGNIWTLGRDLDNRQIKLLYLSYDS